MYQGCTKECSFLRILSGFEGALPSRAHWNIGQFVIAAM